MDTNQARYRNSQKRFEHFFEREREMDHEDTGRGGGEPSDSETLYINAKNWLENGQIDQARGALEKALKIEPDFTLALETLSFIYTMEGNLGRSLSCLERLVVLRPDELDHRRALARLYLMGERYDDVIETLGQEVRRRKFMFDEKGDSTHCLTAEDLLALAASYLKSHRLQEAISLMDSLPPPSRKKEGSATWEIGLREVLDRLLCLVEEAENPFISYLYKTFPFAKKLRLALPLLYDLDILLEDIRDRPPQKTGKQGLVEIQREEIKRKLAYRETPNGPMPRSQFLEVLVWEAGLLFDGPQGIVLSPQGEEYLQSGPRDQFRLILKVWQQAKKWNELFEIEGLEICQGQGHRSYGRGEDSQRDLKRRREVILVHLQAFDLGKLYPIGTLWEKIAFHHPDLLRLEEERTGPRAWRICRKKPDEETASWEELEGRLIESLLKGPLSWLDLAGVIQQDDGRVTHFFLKPLIYFGQRPTGKIDKALSMKRNLEIKVDLASVDRFDLREIERFSELKLGYGETNLYRITTRSLERGLKKGLTLDRFLKCLERNYGTTLPLAIRQGILTLVSQD